MKIRSRPLRRISQILGLMLILAAAAELVFRFAFSTSAERRAGAEALFRSHESQAFPSILTSDGCAHVDQLSGNPYLNSLYRTDGPCRLPVVNNMGFRSDRFHPVTYKAENYALLVTGGERAERIAMTDALEYALNVRFHSPRGPDFRTYNAAMPTWSIADQLKAVTLLAPTVDAVVILGGKNEAAAWNKRQLDSPIPNHYLHTHHFEGGAVWRETTQSFRRMAVRAWPFRHSHFLYRLFSWSAAKYERDWLPADLGSTILGAYDFPAEWSAAKRGEWNARKFAAYLDTFRGMGEGAKIQIAYVAEPFVGEAILGQVRSAGARGLPVVENLSNEARVEEIAEQLGKLWRLKRK